ncbi:MAG: DUF3105 domain-containing protein [Gaiellaceae bacterium]|jgi:hypothetical protein
MAEKPRVKAPKQRATTSSDDSARMRQLLLLGGVVAALVIAGVLFAAVGRGGGVPDEAAVRADLEAAGCTLQAVKAQPGRHSLTADGTAKWNTDPPTNGPHFGFDASGQLGTVVWGAYEEPLQLARVVHNLEHGGIYIFYGDEVSDAVVDQLRGFYDDHKNGTLLAPYPKLGNKVALGAWVSVDGEDAKGYLAKCPGFDEAAYSAFFEAFQFKGPERFPSGSLLPGDN